MADKFTSVERSAIMRKVKSKSNKSTELKLIAFFKHNSIKGWRRNYKLFGRPDFVFPKNKTAVFVDGCFWHGHNCRNLKPQQNKEYWVKKITRNSERDSVVNITLTSKGWNVIRIWECDFRKKDLTTLFI